MDSMDPFTLNPAQPRCRVLAESGYSLWEPLFMLWFPPLNPSKKVVRCHNHRYLVSGFFRRGYFLSGSSFHRECYLKVSIAFFSERILGQYRQVHHSSGD